MSVENSTSDPEISQIVTVDADGNAYFEYLVNTGQQSITCGGDSETTKFDLKMMTVFADGSTSTQLLASRVLTGSSSADTSGGSDLTLGPVTPDGQGGALAIWLESFPNSGTTHFMVSHVSPGSQADFHLTTFDTGGPGDTATIVLDDNGVGYLGGTPGGASQTTILAFDINSGQTIWTAQPGLAVISMFARDGGGVIVSGTDRNRNSMATSIDPAGNVGSLVSTDSVLTDTWSGNWLTAGAGGLSSRNLPFAVNQASFWPELFGNPSQSGFGVPRCPCIVQTPGTATPTQLQTEPASSVQPAGTPLVYVQLVGDPGLNTSSNCSLDPDHCHNVGSNFNLSASTQADSLSGSGNAVITDRISSVQDFNNGLTTNGTITGGVTYFGHGAQMRQTDGTYLSLLAPGQASGVDTNVSALNVNKLSNLQLASNIRITLNACNAGLRPIYGGGHSIAQLIANQLNRPVLAWKIGMFFANDLTTRFPKKLDPQSSVLYMVPLGGSSIAPCTFTPNQPEPNNCGGVK